MKNPRAALFSILLLSILASLACGPSFLAQVPTPTATPTKTPKPPPTNTPDPALFTPTPTPLPPPTNTPTITPLPPTETPEPTATEEADATPVPTDTPEPTAKLSDYGLALHLGGDETRLTATEALLGTVDYVSPEQANGRVVNCRPFPSSAMIAKTRRGINWGPHPRPRPEAG